MGSEWVEKNLIENVMTIWTTYLKKFQPIHLPFVPDLNIPDEFDKKIKHIEGLATYQHKQLAVCHRRFYHIQSAVIQNF